MTTSRASLLLMCTLVLACGLVHPVARADGVVYKCVDSSGRVEFTDIGKAGCKPLDLPGYVPAPRAPSAGPAAGAPGAARPVLTRPAANAVAPNGFPRVDSAAQRARDADRRDILNDELHAEQAKLNSLRRDFNNGEPERQGNEKNYAKYQERVATMRDDITRSEKNIEALQRELSTIR